MHISNIYLISFFILIIIFLMANLLLKIIKDHQKIIKIIFNFKVFFLLKKRQAFFYVYEKFKQDIKIRKKKYYKIQNYLFLKKKLHHKYFLKNVKRVILVYHSLKSNYFDYSLDKKKFNKIIDDNSINYLKINTENKKKIQFEVKNNEKILNTFFIKKNEKKNLVLILILDGLSNQLSSMLPYSRKFFLNNNFQNAHTNAEWSFPVFSNLITGQYSSTHLNYNPITYYSDINFLDDSTYINSKSTLFEYFKSLNFVTGCYSPYVRINPTYNFDRGVDFFNFCEDQNATVIIDKIISQIETFNDCSNFICAHFFDVKEKPSTYTSDRSSFVFLDDNNFDYKNDNKTHLNTAHKSKREKFKMEKTKFEREKLFSEIRYIDLRLNQLYNYLNNKKFDNLTVILMGDHGTRGDLKNTSNNFVKENINRSYSNIGFFIKDNKYNFKKKKSNLIETIDIFPSLASRYKDVYNYKKVKKQFDGMNTLFSNIKKNYTVSESIYGADYETLINLKNYSMFSSYKLKDDKILARRKRKFIDKKNIEIKSISKEIKLRLEKIENKHNRSSKLIFYNKKI